MLIHPEDKSRSGSRSRTVESVRQAMVRFPLVVEVLGKLEEVAVPCAGDAEIQHGCRRALTAILVELSRIEPAVFGNSVEQERVVMEWLDSPAAARLVDADQLERFQHFIDRILAPRMQQ